jgi:biopolymer transport protein TolR
MGKAQTEEHYVITIKKDKLVFINNQPINIHLLEERLAQLSAIRQDKKVFIKADNDVPYGFVLLVMDKAKAAGIENFGLITEPLIK